MKLGLAVRSLTPYDRQGQHILKKLARALLKKRRRKH